MKRTKHFILSVSMLLFFAGTENVQAQQVFKTTNTSVIGYLEYLPSDYLMNSDKYPVVIFLHGIGERGYDSTDPTVLSTSIQRVAKLGPPMFVKNGTQFPFILISPQLKSNYGNWPSNYVMEVINHVKTYLRIDEKRIYLTGLSLGGGGAWWTAQDNPQLFAALAPVCGGRNSISLACGIAAENLPVWAFHGDKDTIVPLSRTVNMVNAINACLPKINPEARLTVYPGVAHDAWNYAYRIDNSLHTPNVYEWMLSFRNTINHGNSLPSANAGLDRSISGASFSMAGSASDADGSIAAYLWTQLAGPSVATLTNATTSTLTASQLREGKYVFSFRVTDNGGASDTDYVTLMIGTTNQLPIVNAGTDKTIYLPTNSIVLNGTASDPDGSIEGYVWTKISGPTVSMSGTNTASLTASNLLPGAYVFRLTVTDNAGLETHDEINISVKEPIAPFANAGTDQIVYLPTNSVKLTGTASDSDGTIKTVSWTKILGADAQFSDATSFSPTASGLVLGTYTFRLTVTDNHGAQAFDDVSVTVKEPVAPVANAGPNKVVVLPSSLVTISGSATDADGTVTTYQWIKKSGASCNLSGTTTASLNVSGLTGGSYVFRLNVTDETGLSDYDDVLVNVTLPPMVSAGPDKSLDQPSDLLTLTGTASDHDGTIRGYAWSKYSGPSVYMENKNTPSLTLLNIKEGTYVFVLKAIDNFYVKSEDYVTVTVNNPMLSASSSTLLNSKSVLEATAIGLPMGQEGEMEKPLLGHQTSADLENSVVTIFNGSGKKIFSGTWTLNEYDQVFKEDGLYIYTVVKSGKNSYSGKLYIRHNAR